LVKTVLVIGERGKTLLIFGLLKKLSMNGLKVGYFKPIAKARYRLPSTKYIDPDAAAIKEALSLREPLEDLSPILVSRSYLELKEGVENVKKKIRESFERVSSDKDVVIVEGYSPPEAFTSLGLGATQIAEMLDAKTVYIADAKGREIVDEIVDRVNLYKCYFGYTEKRLDGVIINNVPVFYAKRIESLIAPEIEKNGVRIYGIVTERPRLIAPTVKDIVEALNAEVLEGKEYLNNMVEDILIGAMSPEAALRWLRRAINAAIITGGDRTDLIMQALGTKPSVVILTGNLYPTTGVLVKAREIGIPLLLVPYDTYTTVEKLREVQAIVTADSLKAKEKEILEVVDTEIKWRELLDL